MKMLIFLATSAAFVLLLATLADGQTINASVMTWSAFIVAAANGGFAWTYTRRFQIAGATRLQQIFFPIGRFSCALLTFLTLWINGTYLLWRAGVPLDMAVIDNGRMGETWPVAIACIVLALLSWLFLWQEWRRKAGKPTR